MSVTTSSGGPPNRVRIAFEFIKSRGTRGISKEDLELYLSPKSLAEPEGQTIDDPLLLARNLRLVSLNKGVYTASEELIESDLSFLELMEERLLRPKTPDEYDQADFQKALAWFLLQSPTLPIERGSNPRSLVEAQVSGNNVFELMSSTPFENFVYWARFLGFAQLMVFGGKTMVVPDPTEAFRRQIEGGYLGSGVFDPDVFLKQLSDRLPVLDFGSVRTDVESSLKPEYQVRESELSATMTFALMRLEKSGNLVLHDLDDSPHRIQLSPATRLLTRLLISGIEVV